MLTTLLFALEMQFVFFLLKVMRGEFNKFFIKNTQEEGRNIRLWFIHKTHALNSLFSHYH